MPAAATGVSASTETAEPIMSGVNNDAATDRMPENPFRDRHVTE